MVAKLFFNPAMVTQMRRLQVSSLVDSALIRRSTAVDDGGGGTTETVTYLGPYACRVAISRLQRGEVLLAGQLQGQIPSTVTLPAETDVRLSDRINVNGTLVDIDFVGGTTYEVMSIYAPTTYESGRSCLCIKR